MGHSEPCDNTSTVTRIPSVCGHKKEEWHFPSGHERINLSHVQAYLIPGDGVIESINGLIFTCNSVIVSDIKLCIFLDHIFALSQRIIAVNKLGHTKPQQDY